MDWQKQELERRRHAEENQLVKLVIDDKEFSMIIVFWNNLIEENAKLLDKLRLQYAYMKNRMLLSPYSKQLILVWNSRQIQDSGDTFATNFHIRVDNNGELCAIATKPGEEYITIFELDESSPAQIVKNLVTGAHYWSGLKEMA